MISFWFTDLLQMQKKITVCAQHNKIPNLFIVQCRWIAISNRNCSNNWTTPPFFFSSPSSCCKFNFLLRYGNSTFNNCSKHGMLLAAAIAKPTGKAALIHPIVILRSQRSKDVAALHVDFPAAIVKSTSWFQVFPNHFPK